MEDGSGTWLGQYKTPMSILSDKLDLAGGAKSMYQNLQQQLAMKDAKENFGDQIQAQQPYRLAEAGQGDPLPKTVEDAYQQAMRGQGDTSSLPMTTPVPTKEKTKQDQEKNKLKTNAQNQYEKNMRKFMEHREKLIRNSEEQARLMRGGENRVDLSSLMALADSETGSNLARSYKAPMTPERREQLAQAMEARAGQGYGALANNEYQMATLNNQRDKALRDRLTGGLKPMDLQRIRQDFSKSGEKKNMDSYVNFSDELKDYKSALQDFEEKGSPLTGKEAARVEALFNKLLTTINRDEAKLGALAGEDLNILRGILKKQTGVGGITNRTLSGGVQSQYEAIDHFINTSSNKANKYLENTRDIYPVGVEKSIDTYKDRVGGIRGSSNIPFDPDSFIKGI